MKLSTDYAIEPNRNGRYYKGAVRIGLRIVVKPQDLTKALRDIMASAPKVEGTTVRIADANTRQKLGMFTFDKSVSTDKLGKERSKRPSGYGVPFGVKNPVAVNSFRIDGEYTPPGRIRAKLLTNKAEAKLCETVTVTNLDDPVMVYKIHAENCKCE